MYASDDHLMVFNDRVDAEKHEHLFSHLFICLENDPNKMLNVQINDEDIHCRAIIIKGGVKHAFKGNHIKHALVLIDHTSRLGRCVERHYLSPSLNYHLITGSLVLPLTREFQAIPGHVFCTSDYQTIWTRILILLDLNECIARHDINDRRIITILNQLKSSNTFNHQISRLAQQVYLSPSRLSHLFSQHTGGTLKSYLLFRQLLIALMQIANGKSVTDAALNVGFDSPSHLSATCKRVMGIQPNIANQVSVFLKVSRYH